MDILMHMLLLPVYLFCFVVIAAGVGASAAAVYVLFIWTVMTRGLVLIPLAYVVYSVAS